MTATLTDVRNAAVQLRDNADTLVKNIDDLLANPLDFERSFEQLKEQVLQSFLGTKLPTSVADTTPKVKTTTKPRSRYACDICAAEGNRYTAKNDAGLAIHKGRTHGRKADREAKAAEAQVDATKADDKGESWEYAKPEGERVPA